MLFLSRRRTLTALVLLAVASIPPPTFAAENLGVSGSRPKWKVLEKYNETITHDDFAQTD